MNRLFIYVLISLFCALACIHAGYAQGEGRAVIKMQLVDSLSGNSIAYATIAIYREGEKEALRYGVSNAEGYAEVVKMEKGSYLVSIDHVSYLPVLKYISTREKRVIDFGKVLMVERSELLEEAVVTGEVAIVQKGDTTEYNAKFFHPAPTDYLGDLLKKMPGLEIRGSDIYFKGVKVQSLTVEGRPFFMSDNSIALENLPAYAVKKVSVFKRNRSMMTGIEDVANAPLQLNIVLQDGMKSGLIGNLTPGYGSESRYLAKGLLGRFGRKGTVALMLSANNISKDAGSGSSYHFTSNGAMIPPVAVDAGGYDGDIQTILTGIDYARSKNNSNDLAYLNGTYRRTNNFLTTRRKRETSLSGGTLLTNSDRISENRSDNMGVNFRKNSVLRRSQVGKRDLFLNFSTRLNYKKGEMEEVERFSTVAQGDVTGNNGGERFALGETEDIGVDVQSYLNMGKGDADFYFSGMNIGLSYTNFTKDYRNYSFAEFEAMEAQRIDQKKKDVNDYWRLHTGMRVQLLWGIRFHYNLEYRHAISQATAWDYNFQTELYEKLADRSTGCLKNRTLEHELELCKQITRVDGSFRNYWTISVKAVPIWMQTTGDHFSASYRRWSFIPLVSYRSLKLRFEYTGKIHYPSLQQLQPIINNDNPLYIYVGNATLHPAYTHTLNYSQKVGLFNVGLDAGLTQRKIIQKRTIDSLGVTCLLPVNENGSYYTKADVRLYRLALSRRLSVHASVSGRYVRGVGYTNNERYTSDNLTTNGTMGLTYRNTFFEATVKGYAMCSNSIFSAHSLKREATWTNGGSANINWALPWAFNLLTKYDYTTYVGFRSDHAPSSVWNVELCKTAFKKRGVFSLKGYDLLNQTKNLKITYADSYMEETSVNMICRYMMFSASFKFGNF